MLVTACQDRKYQYPDSSVREELGSFTKKKEHLYKKMEVSNYTPQQLADIFLSKSSEWRLLANVQNYVCGKDKKAVCAAVHCFLASLTTCISDEAKSQRRWELRQCDAVTLSILCIKNRAACTLRTGTP